MTLFEYLAIAFSLVFSFSAKRLLAGLPFAIQPERRYWVHLTLTFTQLMATTAIFWIFWSFNGVIWTFPTFVIVLASPSLLYVNSCALIPQDPSLVESWRDYYYSVRRRYFVGAGLWALVVAGVGTLVLNVPWDHPTRAVQASILVAAVVGTISENPRVHAAIAACIVGLVLTAGLIVFQPGALAH